MSVTVRIPGPLRSLTLGKAEVAIEAHDVENLVEELDKSYNGLKARICDADGSLRRFVNVYVNDEDIRFLQNLQTTLKAGDQVSIIPAIAGGAS
jgi:molybdopterin synthase sulfur carrier subunit